MMRRYLNAILIVSLYLPGCAQAEKERMDTVSSCDDVKLGLGLSCDVRGGGIYATIAVTNNGESPIDIPRYELVQTHEDDASQFQVASPEGYMRYVGTQYQYDNEFRNRCIRIEKGQRKEYEWRLDRSYKFEEGRVYTVRYSSLISFGKGVLCKIESSQCELKYDK